MNKIQTYLLEAIVGIHQWQEQEVHCLAKVRYITNHWNLHGITCKYMENSKWQTNKTGRNEVQIDIICGIVCPMIHEGNIASYLNKENGQKEDWIDLFPYTKCNPNIKIISNGAAIRNYPFPHEHTYLSNPSGWSSGSVMLWAFNARVESRLFLFTTSKACLAMSLYLT